MLRVIRLTSKQTKKLAEKADGSAAQNDVLTSFLGDNDPKRACERRLPIMFFSSKQAKHISERNGKEKVKAADRAKAVEQAKAAEKMKAAEKAKAAGAAAKSAAASNEMSLGDFFSSLPKGTEVDVHFSLSPQARKKNEGPKIMNKLDGGTQQKFNGGLLATVKSQVPNRGLTINVDRQSYSFVISGPCENVSKMSDAFTNTKLGKGKFVATEHGIRHPTVSTKLKPAQRMTAQEKAAEAVDAAAAAMKVATLGVPKESQLAEGGNVKTESTTRIVFGTKGEDANECSAMRNFSA